MSVLLEYAARCCVAAGLITGAVTLAIGRDLRAALRMALDFWLAAGLLRLGGTAGWQPLLGTAAIVAVRQLVGRSLRRPAAVGGPGAIPRWHPPKRGTGGS